MFSSSYIIKHIPFKDQYIKYVRVLGSNQSSLFLPFFAKKSKGHPYIEPSKIMSPSKALFH